MNPKVRDGLLHVGTAVAASWATLSFTASHGVDLYAIYEQLNVVVKDVSKLIAMAAPVVSGAYAVWLKTRKNMIADAATAPEVRGIVTSPELARNIPSDKVQPTVAELPPAAQAPEPPPPAGKAA